jgi:hypothetical protein
MKHTTSKRERGIETPSQRNRLADRRAIAADHRAWHEARAVEAGKRREAAAEAKRKAGPQGGRLRALALLAERLATTPVTAAAVRKVERERRPVVSHVNRAKDRSLPGKARIRARRAGAR